MEDEVQFFTNQKGTLCIHVDSYIYKRDKKLNSGGEVVWRCRDYRKFKCHGMLFTQVGIVTNRKGEHNHFPEPSTPSALKTISYIAEKSKKSRIGNRRIIDKELSHIPKKYFQGSRVKLNFLVESLEKEANLGKIFLFQRVSKI